jgi:hypothetical protein
MNKIISLFTPELRDWEMQNDFLVEFVIMKRKFLLRAIKAYKGSKGLAPLIRNLGPG